jgi:hypothetical protein
MFNLKLKEITMFRSSLFKVRETLIKIPKTKCGTIAGPSKMNKPTFKCSDIPKVSDKGEHHRTQSSPMFQTPHEVEKSKDNPPRNFTYRTLKATVHVTYRNTEEENNENSNSPKP